ncbi:MAG: ParB/RepB/Spo0J family partition protein [Verrucomicrobiota bacterium]
MATKKGLGRGLSALMGSEKLVAPEPNTARGESVSLQALDKIEPSPLQPRKVFDADQLAELIESIRQRGIIQPLIVRPGASGKLELIAGERRWRAAREVGLEQAPVIIRQATDQEVLELALVENLQRADLDPLEEAEGYQRLMGSFNLTQEQVAEKVGKKRATVANAVRLLGLHEDVKSLLRTGRLSVGHAKALLGLGRLEEQMHAAEKVVRQALNVRETESLVERMKLGTAPVKKGKKAAANGAGEAVLADLERRLQQALGTRVKFHGTATKGKIELEYFNADDLERLLERLGVTGE